MSRQAQPNPVLEPATLVGAGILVRGRITGEEDLHVEGRLEGNIELTETVFVTAEGIVVANIRARDVVVSGIVVGNVVAEDSVTLNPGAKLIGDMTAPRVIVADGAAFSGNVAMGGEPPPRRARRPAAARKPTDVGVGNKVVASAAAPRAAVSDTSSRTRVAAIPQPRRGKADDEKTVIVRHAEVEDSSNAPANSATEASKPPARKASKKAPPRARVPKPGKRRVGRR